MIVATFLGGPRDGEAWQLPDCTRRVRVPVLRNHHASYSEFVEAGQVAPAADITVVEVQPELTVDGWVLRWPRGAA